MWLLSHLSSPLLTLFLKLCLSLNLELLDLATGHQQAPGVLPSLPWGYRQALLCLASRDPDSGLLTCSGGA